MKSITCITEHSAGYAPGGSVIAVELIVVVDCIGEMMNKKPWNRGPFSDYNGGILCYGRDHEYLKADGANLMAAEISRLQQIINTAAIECKVYDGTPEFDKVYKILSKCW